MKGKDNYNKNALRDEHKLWWEKRKQSDTFFLVLTRLAMNRDYLLFKLEGSFDVTESSGDATPVLGITACLSQYDVKFIITWSLTPVLLLTYCTLESFLANSLSWALQNYKRMVSILQMRC